MNKVKEVLKENVLTKGIYEGLSKIYNHKYLTMSDEDFAKIKYKKRMGINLNLDNPQTFDDKIWWLKINYHNPLITMCSDKYWAREYVKMCGYEDTLIDL